MGDAVELNVDAWERDFRISVTSMILMSRHVTPEMRENGRAVIVNMGSVSGCESFSNMNQNDTRRPIC